MENIIHIVVDFLRDKLSAEFVVFIVSMLPILELRGGLIAAALLNIDWVVAFPICVIGNLIPIPLELLFIRKIFDLLRKIKGLDSIIDKLEKRAEQKANTEKMQKYANWGLFALVAIPLPGTGAWTGGLVADVLDMRVKRAFPIIALGVISAGLITSFFTYILPLFFM